MASEPWPLPIASWPFCPQLVLSTGPWITRNSARYPEDPASKRRMTIAPSVGGGKNKTAATVRQTHTDDRRISSLPPCWPAWRSNELGGRSLGYYFGSGRIATASARTGDLQPHLVAGHGASVRGHHGVAAHVLGGLEGNVVARYCAFGDGGVHGGAVAAGPGTVTHQFAALDLKGESNFGGRSI